MKAFYEYNTDTLTVSFSEDPVVESDEDKEGVILDYGASGTSSWWRYWMPRSALLTRNQ